MGRRDVANVFVNIIKTVFTNVVKLKYVIFEYVKYTCDKAEQPDPYRLFVIEFRSNRWSARYLVVGNDDSNFIRFYSFTHMYVKRGGVKYSLKWKRMIGNVNMRQAHQRAKLLDATVDRWDTLSYRVGLVKM